MSGRGFGIITPLVVIAVGVVSGINIFKPALEKDARTLPPQPPPSSPSPSPVVASGGASISPLHPQEPVKSSEKPADASKTATRSPISRWAQFQDSQFSQPQDEFE